MASEEENETRFTKIEQRVRQTETGVAEARVLAQGADRDVASFGEKLAVQKSLIEAVRETQVTHSKDIRELNEEVRNQGHRLMVLDLKVDSLKTEMREGFARQAVGQGEITALLNRIIDDNK
jgi:hypothetical protein